MDARATSTRRYLGALATVLLAAPAGALGAVSGTVFRDYDHDGARDAREPGQAGVVVSAVGPSGQVAQQTTNAAGEYNLAIPDGTRVRLEVGALPAGAAAGPRGAGAAGLVQFHTAPASGIATGVSYSVDYCQANPALAVSCFVFGPSSAQVAATPTEPALRWVPFDAADGASSASAGRVLATHGQVGAVWGTAWRPAGSGSGSGELFAGSFLKRHVGLGPNRNPGTIYRIPVTGQTAGTPSVLTTLPAGADTHPADTAGLDAWRRDGASWDAVGKVGLGDVDISADGETIYAVNLADRRLYRIPRQNPAGASSVAIPQPAGCAATDWRPFGLGVFEGRVYAGVVCTNQSTQAVDATFAAHVYRTDAAVTAFATAPVVSVPLAAGAYPRKCNGTANTSASDNLNPACGADGLADWRPWLTAAAPSSFYAAYPSRSQPWLSDIVFDGSDMVLGFRDRFGDQTGNGTYAPAGIDTTLYYGIGQGDQLRACATGTGFALEQNGSCGGVTGGGVGNAEGPGGGEFYNGDDNYFHDHISLGGLAQIPGRDVAGTVIDPFPGQTQVFNTGILWSDNATGRRSRSHEVQASGTGFGKANGLGDLEALCEAAPIQIGDRVFADEDADGIQDPGEPGIAGVNVTIRTGQGQIGETTTDANGTYLFGGAQNTGLIGGNVLAPQTTYTIAFAAPAGARISPQDVGADNIDSDPAADGTVQVTTGRPGANDHTVDAGFVRASAPGALRILKEVRSPLNGAWLDADQDAGTLGTNDPTPALHLSGERATFRITVTNTGPVALGGITVTDTDCDLNTIVALLAPGESRALLCTRESLRADLVNTASAQGARVSVGGVLTGPVLATQSERAAVRVVSASYTLLKEVQNPQTGAWVDADQDAGSPGTNDGVAAELFAGEGARYRITATNTGQVDIRGLAVRDEGCGLDRTIDLPIGQAIPLTCERADVRASATNTASAQGGAPILPDGRRLTPEGAPLAPLAPRSERAQVTVFTGAYTLLKEVQDPATGAWLDGDSIAQSPGTNNGLLPTVAAGRSVRFRIILTNTGNAALNDVAVQDPLVSLNAVAMKLPPGERAVFEFAHIIGQDVVNVALTRNGRPSTPGGRLGQVLAPATETAGVRVTGAQIAGLADRSRLGLTKVGPLRAPAGSLVVYKITVRVPKNARAAARRVTVRDFLPRGLAVANPLTLKKAGGEIFRGRVVWRLGTLAPGRTRTLSVILRVSRDAPARVTNRARVTSDNAQPVVATAQTRVIAGRARPPVQVTG